jgi:hypothetical protein
MRYAYVIALLVGVIVARPILPPSFIHQVAVLGVAFTAWITVHRESRSRIPLAILLVPALVALGSYTFVSPSADASKILEGILLFLAILLLFYSAWNILTSLLSKTHVVLDDILGAVSLYLILGFTWAFSYSAIELFSPDSFTAATPLPEPLEGEGRGAITSRFVYFSFITLATQGYGDITPASELAESAVILETIAGQFYIALVIAYLLAVHVAHRVSEHLE